MAIFTLRTTLIATIFALSTAASSAVTLDDVVDDDGIPQLPENFRSWEFLGAFSGLAADKNGSHEMHTVYASPGTVEYYQQNNAYPDAAVLVKEVLETDTENLTTGRISYATKTKGWFVWIKDSKGRFPESKLWGDGWGWAFYAAGDKPKLQTTDYKTDCLGCHVPAKDTDYSYVRGYPVLEIEPMSGGQNKSADNKEASESPRE
ncbi:cytochrome P460 family protein [Paraglaciecola polaris]|uniref:Cytochrome P460 domain-containing protein n=1 Tax=Paraglaciecola polaris LMG 21857 TaxID=1129793 RepID=K6ZA81_9ALTE|nr:cytochrome P460 family protein [Paraglaciecola polaris]GAC33046.1 hypothetical protein GPLA_2141 [Paraglaciecola polaris LMG 21857]|tara:strand:+ start:13342 stop:13956 length:615 start_codon:yes stop_codon:yes gene_type:complete